MLKSMGIFEIAAKAATTEGVKAVHVSLTAKGLCCIDAYNGTNYIDDNCKAANLYLDRKKTKEYNKKEIDKFFKTIESWQKKN